MRRNAAGFTLVELLVVIVIVAIVAAAMFAPLAGGKARPAEENVRPAAGGDLSLFWIAMGGALGLCLIGGVGTFLGRGR